MVFNQCTAMLCKEMFKLFDILIIIAQSKNLFPKQTVINCLWIFEILNRSLSHNK